MRAWSTQPVQKKIQFAAGGLAAACLGHDTGFDDGRSGHQHMGCGFESRLDAIRLRFPFQAGDQRNHDQPGLDRCILDG
jgi:hypothetical protein